MKSIGEVTACLATSSLGAAGFVGEKSDDAEIEMDFAIVAHGAASGTPTVSFKSSSTIEAFSDFLMSYAVEYVHSPFATCLIVADHDVSHTLQSVISGYATAR